MSDVVQASSILALIGQGCHRLSEIAARLGKPAEFDVVAESSGGDRLLVGEVKLSATDAELVQLHAKLREKALRLPFVKKGPKVEAVIFSAAASHQKAPSVVTCADMLGALI